MNHPKVSIVVSVYNCKPYLNNCLESLIHQKYKNIEIILVDDGSTDNGYAICKKYALEDQRVIAFDKENGGDSSAKNVGMQKVTGEFIAFVDSDDEVNTNYISDMVDVLDEDTDLVVTGYVVVYTNENRQLEILPKQAMSCTKTERYKAVLAMGTSGIVNVDVGKLYSTRIIRERELSFDESFTTGEDLIFNSKYYPCAHRIVVLQKANYLYFRRDVISLVNKYRENAFDISCKCVNSVKEMMTALESPSDISKQICNSFCLDYMSVCVHNLYREACCLSHGEKENRISDVFDYCKQFGMLETSFQNLNSIQRIFIHFCRTGNNKGAALCYSILFQVRNKAKPIWLSLRKWMLK